MKENRNHGFTLIELIVVMAIIAVLGVILAPQYLRYVEKSRVTKDCSEAAEILEATNVSAMDEGVYDRIPDSGATLTWVTTDEKKCEIRCADFKTLEDKVNDIVGPTTRSSRALRNAVWTVEISQSSDTKTISTKASWSGSSDGKDDEYTRQSGGSR